MWISLFCLIQWCNKTKKFLNISLDIKRIEVSAYLLALSIWTALEISMDHGHGAMILVHFSCNSPVSETREDVTNDAISLKTTVIETNFSQFQNQHDHQAHPGRQACSPIKILTSTQILAPCSVQGDGRSSGCLVRTSWQEGWPSLGRSMGQGEAKALWFYCCNFPKCFEAYRGYYYKFNFGSWGIIWENAAACLTSSRSVLWRAAVPGRRKHLPVICFRDLEDIVKTNLWYFQDIYFRTLIGVVTCVASQARWGMSCWWWPCC